MHIERKRRPRTQLRDRVKPKRHARAEVAVKDIHVQHVDPGRLKRLDAALQIAQVAAGDQRGGENPFSDPNVVHA